MCRSHKIISIEDGFDENDFDAWNMMKEKSKILSRPIMLVGDDLLVTNLKRMDLAIEKNLCNSLLLKMNQIGSITESINSAKKA